MSSQKSRIELSCNAGCRGSKSSEKPLQMRERFVWDRLGRYRTRPSCCICSRCERRGISSSNCSEAAIVTARHRTVLEFREAGGRSNAPRRSRRSIRCGPMGVEAPVDFAAARHRHRRLRPRRLGLPGRDAVLEGVLLRRTAGGDPLPRTPGRRAVALCRLRMERRRPRGRSCARTGPTRRASSGRRPVPHHPGRQRLQGVPRVRPHGGARVQRPATVAGHRPRRAPFRASARAGRGSRVPGRNRPARRAPGRRCARRRRGSRRPRRPNGRRSATCTPTAVTATTPRARCATSGSTCAMSGARPDEPAVASAVGRPIRKPAPGQSEDAVLRIEPGHPERSGLAQRMGSRYAALQMPPLGTELVDEQALELVRQWIAGLDGFYAETQREERGK